MNKQNFFNWMDDNNINHLIGTKLYLDTIDINGVCEFSGLDDNVVEMMCIDTARRFWISRSLAIAYQNHEWGN